jgi:hypothetical protein
MEENRKEKAKESFSRWLETTLTPATTFFIAAVIFGGNEGLKWSLILTGGFYAFFLSLLIFELYIWENIEDEVEVIVRFFRHLFKKT